jgi:hypothetical protein
MAPLVMALARGAALVSLLVTLTATVVIWLEDLR